LADIRTLLRVAGCPVISKLFMHNDDDDDDDDDYDDDDNK